MTATTIKSLIAKVDPQINSAWGVDAELIENQYGFSLKIRDDIKDSDDMLALADGIIDTFTGKKNVLFGSGDVQGMDDIFSFQSVIDGQWFFSMVVVLGASHSSIMANVYPTELLNRNHIVGRMCSIL